jgi:hypothetical protein
MQFARLSKIEWQIEVVPTAHKPFGNRYAARAQLRSHRGRLTMKLGGLNLADGDDDALLHVAVELGEYSASSCARGQVRQGSVTPETVPIKRR